MMIRKEPLTSDWFSALTVAAHIVAPDAGSATDTLVSVGGFSLPF